MGLFNKFFKYLVGNQQSVQQGRGRTAKTVKGQLNLRV